MRSTKCRGLSVLLYYQIFFEYRLKIYHKPCPSVGVNYQGLVLPAEVNK